MGPGDVDFLKLCLGSVISQTLSGLRFLTNLWVGRQKQRKHVFFSTNYFRFLKEFEKA